jgi:hypothetical protein
MQLVQKIRCLTVRYDITRNHIASNLTKFMATCCVQRLHQVSAHPNKIHFFFKTIIVKVLSCWYSWLQKKKTGNENFPNVNLVLSICQLTILTYLS